MHIEVTDQELETIIDALGTQFLEYGSTESERLADRLRSEKGPLTESEPHSCGHFHPRCCINY